MTNYYSNLLLEKVNGIARFIDNSRYLMFAVSVVFISAIVIRAVFIHVPPFQSDESVYVYAGYAISRGEIPYKEIVLNQPPVMYLFFALVIKLFGNTIEVIRESIGLLYFLCSIFLILIANEVLRDFSERVIRRASYIGMLLIAIFPGTLSFSMTGTVETLLTLFLLSSTFFFIYASRKNSTILMLIAGALFGLAFFTKFLALLMLLPFIGLLLLPSRQPIMNKAKVAMLFGAGFFAISLSLIIVIGFVWSGFEDFVNQTITFQSTFRPTLTLLERFETIRWYYDAFSIPLLLSVPAVIILVRSYIKTRRPAILLPVLTLIPLAIQLFLISSLFHHMLYLLPFFYLMSGITIYYKIFVPSKIDNTILMTAKFAFVALLIVVSANYIVTASTDPHRISPYVYSLDPSPYNIAEMRVGEEIKKLTDPEDRIWTSEGAIAFFADRLITTPSSQDWPVAAFFDDWLGITLDNRRGNDLVSIRQFVEHFEVDNTKVIVIIQGRGWVPYPDPIMFNGYEDNDGIMNYLENNYALAQTITINNNPYVYQIWLRNN